MKTPGRMMALCAALTLPPTASAVAGGNVAASRLVTLEIANATGVSLRCVAVLAHFVTRDLPPIAPGEALELELSRFETGAIGYGAHDGRPMLVENVLCGRADAWTASRTDVPVDALRTGAAPALSVTCTGNGGLHCAAD